MTARSKSEIKEFFETGDRPTQAQFGDLVDSYINTSAAGTVGSQILSCVTTASVSNVVAGGLGTMAIQNANSVAISGGALRGVTVSGATVIKPIVTAGTFNAPAITNANVSASIYNGVNIATVASSRLEIANGETLSYETGSFTPAWTASVNPAIGSGTITGSYTKVGKLVYAGIRISAGSTTTFGTGDYHFGNLPYPAGDLNMLMQQTVLGQDTGTSYRQGFTYGAGTASVQIGNATLSTFWSPTVPHTWASTDVIAINLVYQTA